MYPVDVRGSTLKTTPDCFIGLDGYAREILKGILLAPDEIREYTVDLARNLQKEYSGTDFTALVCANGALPFFTDVFFRPGEKIGPGFTYQTVNLSSYQGTESTGCVQIAGMKPEELRPRIIVVEDIVDTGQSLSKLLECLDGFENVEEVKVAALLSKPDRRKVDVSIDYLGFIIPDEFVVGYGLDYNGLYRGLQCIGVLKESAIAD